MERLTAPRTRRALAGLAAAALVAGCTTGPVPGPTSGQVTAPGGFPCPAFARPQSASPRATLTAGRVHVGRVSYPSAPAPFSAVSNAEYVPFANLVGGQSAPVEASTTESIGWQSAVALARLSSVDGAWGGERAAEVVSQCSLSVTWIGIDYQPQVRRDEATTVDGRPGWIRVTDLRFTVPGVRTNSEVQTVVIVQAGDESYAYLSYLPGSAPELGPLLDATRSGLRVTD